jgi:hypothetical protein
VPVASSLGEVVELEAPSDMPPRAVSQASANGPAQLASANEVVTRAG